MVWWRKKSTPPQYKPHKAGKYEELIAEIHELQSLNADLLLRSMDSAQSDGDNEYATHASQVDEIIAKYTGTGSIGNELVKRIINVSAAIQIPDGIELAVIGEGEEVNSPELYYIGLCCKANALDAAGATFYSRELQQQGQLLFHLVWDPADNLVKMRYMPWHVYKYRVKSLGLNNLLPPYQVTWEDPDGNEQSIAGDEVAYIGANITMDSDGYIEGWPTVGALLNRIDAIGRDLLGWSQSNKLYSYPTPHVQTGDRENAKQVANRIRESGWTVGQMLVTNGVFTMVVPQNYYETLEQAILLNLKLISGGTGISIGWLGFADLMGSRSTSQSLGEPIEIASSADITHWKTFFTNLFNSMIRLRNRNLREAGSELLKVNQVMAKIRPISDRQWKVLTEVFMPAAKGNLITIEGFLERIPDFDLKAELGRREKIKKEEGQQAVEPIQPERGSSMRIKPGKSSLIETKDDDRTD
jgi:hypothetical protein